MADELKETDTPKAPPTKEEWRNIPHSYIDNFGWCLTCGRSEGWKAHTVKKVDEKPAAPASPRRRSNPTE